MRENEWTEQREKVLACFQNLTAQEFFQEVWCPSLALDQPSPKWMQAVFRCAKDHPALQFPLPEVLHQFINFSGPHVTGSEARCITVEMAQSLSARLIQEQPDVDWWAGSAALIVKNFAIQLLFEKTLDPRISEVVFFIAFAQPRSVRSKPESLRRFGHVIPGNARFEISLSHCVG